jgi:hypothetical protein
MPDKSDIDLLFEAMTDTNGHAIDAECDGGKWEIRPDLGVCGPMIAIWWIPNSGDCHQIKVSSPRPLKALNIMLTWALTPRPVAEGGA